MAITEAMFLKKIKNKIKGSYRQLKNSILPDAIILMYHSVTKIDSDPWSLTVTPQNFAEQLNIIRKQAYTLTLQQLVKRLNEGKTVRRTIVITFDDGYANNLNNVKPLLEKHDTPATVFVVTKCIDQKHEFWWDKLDRLLLQTYSLPKLLEFKIQNKNYKWKLEEEMHYSEKNHQDDEYYYIGKKSKQNFPNRLNIYHSLYQLMKHLTDNERDDLLKELYKWANVEYFNQHKLRSLSGEEIVTLAEGGLIEIGSHTISHPFLSELAIELQRDEIRNSKARLENLLGHQVNSFAYPHGMYTKDTVAIVKEAGYNSACTCANERIKGYNDLFLLPRIMVKDCDGDKFERYLSKIK